MRKIFLLFAVITAALLATNCKKDQPVTTSGATCDVSFNINSVTQTGGLKSALDINCSTFKANYVMYKIDGGNFVTIPVFYVGNIPYTNSIKLSAGQHTISEFIVYSDNNTPAYPNDDIVLSCAPHVGSIYGQMIANPLNFTFTVSTDKKNEIKLDVVCYETSTYDNFGFVYFKLNELIVKRQVFFGDFCIKNKADYVGSSYANQPGWVGTGYGDVPAIMKIDVLRGGVFQASFTNEDAAHEWGNKVEVSYVDYKNQTDIFTFNLYILVKVGNSFSYVLFKTWTFNDTSNITEGTDGVVDFVLGNCYDPNNMPDYLFAPYMNLPTTVTYNITACPGANGGYVDALIGGIGSGFDISNGTYSSNCADHSTTINIGQTYNMTVYSSLYPDLLPTFAQGPKWEKINWLYNHLDYFPGYKWYQIQGAIWMFDVPAWTFSTPENGMPALTAADQAMITSMYTQMNSFGLGYKVPPGGWAAIIFIPVNTPGNATTALVQTMFIKIDP